MKSWIPKFVKCLRLGTTDASLAASLEEIIVWMRASAHLDDVHQELVDEYGQEGLSLRFEEFLDRLLIADNSAHEMFATTLSEEQAKKRYRQLIRIFHPDRGAHDQAWLNYRAERINKAFNHYEHRPDTPSVDISTPQPTPPPIKPSAFQKDGIINTKIKYRPNALREKLGDARKVQKRIVYGLLVFSLILILIVFASGRDVDSIKTSDDENVANLELVDRSGDSVEVVDLNADAQKILDQAQWLNDSDALNLDIEPVDDVQNNDTTELSEFDGLGFGQTKPEPRSTVADLNLENDLGDAEPRNSDLIKNVDSGNFNCKQYDDERRATVTSARIFSVRANSNIRTGPSKDCAIKQILSSGQYVTKLKRLVRPDKVWSYVSIGEANKEVVRYGWISDRLLFEVTTGRESDNLIKQPILKQPIVAKPVRKPVQKAVKNKPSPLVVKPTQKSATQANVVQAKQVQAVVGGVNNEKPLNNLEKLQGVISLLEAAFKDGNAQKLSSLYISAGRENKVRGVGKIFDLYSDFFDKTRDRNVVYQVNTYNYSDDIRATVAGQMITMMTLKTNGKKTTSAANFNIEMIKISGDYKIAAFDWKLL